MAMLWIRIRTHIDPGRFVGSGSGTRGCGYGSGTEAKAEWGNGKKPSKRMN
jgi:hypothetical protein